MVSRARLPVEAAELGREFFGVLLRLVSGVFPRSVALRAMTCICSLLRAICRCGGAAATPPGLRFGVGGRWASGAGSPVAVEARRPSGAALMAEARLSQRRRC